MRTSLALLLVLMATSANADVLIEVSSSLIPEELRVGELHQVLEPVYSNGFLNTYEMETQFGRMYASGTNTLVHRIREVEALDKLKDVSESEVFLNAVGEAGVQTVRSVWKIVVQPVETAKSLPNSLQRYAVRIGRIAKRGTRTAANLVTREQRDTAEAFYARNASTSDAERHWSRKLGVNPYSTNLLLRDAIRSIALVDSVGSTLLGIAVPMGLSLSNDMVSELRDDIWNETPEGLAAANRVRFIEAGLSEQDTDGLLKNIWYTPTQIRVLSEAVAALSELEDIASVVTPLSSVGSFGGAGFVSQSLVMLAWYHRHEIPLIRILPNAALPSALATDGVQILALPADRVYWNEFVADVLGAARFEGASRHRIGVLGDVDPAAEKALTNLGWEIVTGLREELRGVEP